MKKGKKRSEKFFMKTIIKQITCLTFKMERKLNYNLWFSLEHGAQQKKLSSRDKSLTGQSQTLSRDGKGNARKIQ